MSKVIVTFEAGSVAELREEMLAMLNPGKVTATLLVSEVSGVDIDITEKVSEEVKPEPKKRASRAKAEDRVPEGVMSPDPIVAATPAGRTTEAFVDCLKAMRAKYGEAIIPKIRIILGKYKTAKDEECLKGSDIQLKDVEAAIADLEKLAETEDNDI